MKNLWLIASLSISGVAFAQSSTTSLPASTMSGTSTTESAAVAPVQKKLPISVSTTSWFYGPAVNDPSTLSSTDDSIGSTTGLDSRHQLGMSYKLSDKLSLTPVIDFKWSMTDAKGKKDNSFRWKDCFIKLKHSDLLTTSLSGNEISVAGDVRYYFPTSETSRTSGNMGGMRLSLNPSIKLGNSAFSISTVNYARVWFQTQTNSASGGALPLIELYTGPQVNYEVSDAITAFVLYETYVDYDNNAVPNTRDANISLADVEPGVDIKIHDRVTLTPYLNWYPNQRLSTTTVNLAASITLL